MTATAAPPIHIPQGAIPAEPPTDLIELRRSIGWVSVAAKVDRAEFAALLKDHAATLVDELSVEAGAKVWRTLLARALAVNPEFAATRTNGNGPSVAPAAPAAPAAPNGAPAVPAAPEAPKKGRDKKADAAPATVAEDATYPEAPEKKPAAPPKRMPATGVIGRLEHLIVTEEHKYGVQPDHLLAIEQDCLRPLPASEIDARKGPGGKMLSYLKGGTAYARANEAFGALGWSAKTRSCDVSFVASKEVDDPSGAKRVVWEGGAKAIVDVEIHPTGLDREHFKVISGTGYHTVQNYPDRGTLEEFLLKSAETDARKRALASLGPTFGLALLFNAEERVDMGLVENDLGAAITAPDAPKAPPAPPKAPPPPPPAAAPKPPAPPPAPAPAASTAPPASAPATPPPPPAAIPAAPPPPPAKVADVIPPAPNLPITPAEKAAARTIPMPPPPPLPVTAALKLPDLGAPDVARALEQVKDGDPTPQPLSNSIVAVAKKHSLKALELFKAAGCNPPTPPTGAQARAVWAKIAAAAK